VFAEIYVEKLPPYIVHETERYEYQIQREEYRKRYKEAGPEISPYL
jgi:hypothetical protein